MMTLRNLAEDCTDSNFNAKLTALRRNGIMKAASVHNDSMLNLTFSYMGLHFQTYRQANDEMAGAAAAGMTMSPQYQEATVRAQRAGLLLRAGLSMLRRFVLWIRLVVSG